MNDQTIIEVLSAIDVEPPPAFDPIADIRRRAKDRRHRQATTSILSVAVLTALVATATAMDRRGGTALVPVDDVVATPEPEVTEPVQVDESHQEVVTFLPRRQNIAAATIAQGSSRFAVFSPNQAREIDGAYDFVRREGFARQTRGWTSDQRLVGGRIYAYRGPFWSQVTERRPDLADRDWHVDKPGQTPDADEAVLLPETFLRALPRSEASMKQLARERVREVMTTRYSFSLPFSSYMYIDDGIAERLRSQIDGAAEVKGEVWIDDDRLIRRVTFSQTHRKSVAQREQLERVVEQQRQKLIAELKRRGQYNDQTREQLDRMASGSSVPGSFTLVTTLELFDFGSPVQVVAPPRDDVISYADFREAMFRREPVADQVCSDGDSGTCITVHPSATPER